MQPIETLRNKHKDQTAVLIGTGPSIQFLAASHIQGDFIVTLNFALNAVRLLRPRVPVYTMQKDGMDVQPQTPEILLVHKHESAKENPAYEPAYVFDNLAFGLAWDKPSCLSVLKILELFGVAHVRCVAFDSVTTGDVRTCRDGSTIQLRPEAPAYLIQACWMLEFLKTMPFAVEWITPNANT